MRSIEDKGCLRQDKFGHQRATPSKWDDAQKWLANSLSRDRGHPPKASPRNSCADDLRLIAPTFHSNKPEAEEEEEDEEELKVECEDSIWRINKGNSNNGKSNSNNGKSNSNAVVMSVCVRDMGTEMTPMASQEPSRTGTPIRAARTASSPIRSISSLHTLHSPAHNTSAETNNKSNNKMLSPLESRAAAWDEAERAKYTARFKREEVKIQAWENHEKRKAEMEMRRMEVKAESLKARAQEKYTNRLAATKRIAEEKRANAEAKLNESAAKTSERADYVRRTGHLPSSFSFKLPKPSFCW